MRDYLAEVERGQLRIAMDGILKLRREIFFVSRAVLDQLEMLKRSDCDFTPSPLVRDLVGIPVRLDSTLPRKVRTGGIRQRDRFATYEAGDMDYAEPLGLAAWEMTDLHCYSIAEPEPMWGLGLIKYGAST